MKTKLYNNTNIATLALSLLASFSVPSLTFAQSGAPQTFAEFALGLLDVLTSAIPLVMVLVLAAFMWGLVKFISKAGDAKSHDEGRTLMVWGTIGIFVMLTIWGILAFLTGEFGFGSGAEFKVLPE